MNKTWIFLLPFAMLVGCAPPSIFPNPVQPPWFNPQQPPTFPQQLPPQINPPPVIPPVQPPQGSESYLKALELAKTSNKKVVVFFSKDNCPPCERMKGETMRDRTVSRNLSNFIVHEANIKEESGLFRKFNVDSTPTLMMIDGNERVIKRNSGFMNPREFNRWLSENFEFPDCPPGG